MKKFTIYHTNDIHSQFEHFTQIQTYLKQNASSSDWILDAGDFADAKHIAVSGTMGKGATVLLELAGYDALAVGNNEYFQGIEGILGLASNRVPLLSCNLVHEDGRTIEEIQSHILSEKNGVGLLIIGVSPYGTYSEFLTLLELDSLDPNQRIEQIIKEEQGNYDICILLSHAGIEQDRIFANELKGIDIIIGGHSHTLMPEVEKIKNTYIHQSGCYGEYIGKLEVEIKNHRIISVVAENIENRFEVDTALNQELEKQTQIGKKYYDRTLYTLHAELDFSPVHECKIMNVLCDILYEQYPCDFVLMHHGILENGISGNVSKTKLLAISPSPLNPTKMVVKGSAIITAMQQSFDEEFCMQEGKGPGFRGTCLGALAVSANVRVKKQPFSMTIDGEEIEPEKSYCIITDDYLQRGTGYTSLFVEQATYYNGFIRDVLETGLSHTEFIEKANIKRII